jgi:UDP-galactopyranose mutase
MMKVDYLIVGAGFTGATLAERLASAGKRVLVVDRRDHIGGNAYDEYDPHGVLVHRYGPHIFHTNSKKVWDYLSQFTEWRPYYHRVRAVVEGKEIPLPFSLASLRALFSPRLADKLEEKLIAHYGYGARVPILGLREAEDPDLRFLADYVYRNVFEGYTLKQWGLRPEELSPTVTARVPVLVSYDTRYFQDTYQAMPKEGYTALFRRMLAHPNIKVLLGADWREVEGEVRFDRLVFTGPIDEFFGYLHGPLPYRSLRFALEHHPLPYVQGVGTVNCPNEHPFKVYYGMRNYGWTVCRTQLAKPRLMSVVMYFLLNLRWLVGDLLFEPDRFTRVRMRVKGVWHGILGKLGKLH